MRRRVGPIVLVAGLVCTPLARAAELDDFARCLTTAGAAYYFAAWCPHCRRQDAIFGSAVQWLRRVDCTFGCRGVESLPTWTFADGSRFAGVASVETLAQKTRCRAGRSRDDDAPATAQSTSGGAHERYEAGVKILEVR